MTPEGARIALDILELDVDGAAKLFRKGKRTVFGWLQDGGRGPPDHIAMALVRLCDGTLTRRGVRKFLRRVGITRRDGDRYAKK